MLIDSHCHLNYDYAPKSPAQLVEEGKQAGVSHFITIGTDAASIDLVQKISESLPEVFHTVGIHPHEAATIEEKDMELLRQAAHHPKCVAIGEIGLDYYYDNSPRAEQQRWLRCQLDVALEMRKPVVIHSRDGEDDLLKELENYVQQLPEGATPGVIHCFSGTAAFGKRCLDLGFYISISGILTFKKAEELRDAVKTFPLSRLLVETDAPYLAPIPFRGKKCEPAMVVHTARKLAEVLGLDFDQVAEQTWTNTCKVFNLKV